MLNRIIIKNVLLPIGRMITRVIGKIVRYHPKATFLTYTLAIPAVYLIGLILGIIQGAIVLPILRWTKEVVLPIVNEIMRYFSKLWFELEYRIRVLINCVLPTSATTMPVVT